MSLALNSLSEKRILVAGACGYIGKATCQTLADLGAHVVCADLDQAKCEEFANRLNEQENKIHCAKGCDFVSNAAICQTMKRPHFSVFPYAGHNHSVVR